MPAATSANVEPVGFKTATGVRATFAIDHFDVEGAHYERRAFTPSVEDDAAGGRTPGCGEL